MGSFWVKIKVLARLQLFLEAVGQNLFPYLFQFLGVTCIPWLIAPFPKPTVGKMSSFHMTFLCSSSIVTLL